MKCKLKDSDEFIARWSSYKYASLVGLVLSGFFVTYQANTLIHMGFHLKSISK
jgi:hypothetical protein